MFLMKLIMMTMRWLLNKEYPMNKLNNRMKKLVNVIKQILAFFLLF